MISNYAIAEAAARVVGLTMAEIRSSSRVQHLATKRQDWDWLMRRTTGMSFPAIGKMRCRDHTTIIYGYYLVEKKFQNGRRRQLTEMLKAMEPYLAAVAVPIFDFNPPTKQPLWFSEDGYYGTAA